MIHLLKHKFRLQYFSDSVDREVKEVYVEAIIAGLAVSLVVIFEPIYLHSLGYSIIQILWFYVQIYIWYAILASFGAMFASRFGYKHAILVSNLFYIGYWAALFLIGTHSWLFVLAPLMFALQKSFFWPAFHADVALASGGQQRSREVGMLYALIEAAFIIGPALGGFISAQFGFAALFIVASLLILSSTIPLFYSPEIYTKHRFYFRNLGRILKQRLDHFFGYWGYAEDLMLQSLWPIYIFILLPSFFNVGLLVTVATLVGALVMLYVGRKADLSGERQKILQLASFGYGLTWIFRFLAQGLGSVFAFDALSKISRDVVRVPEMSISYQTAGTQGPDHAIAYGVFREVSLAVGKVVTALLGILLVAQFGDLRLVFILAGFFTMFYAILKPKK